MDHKALARVEQAIEDIKEGKMVIMLDDEDRENEGDLVYAASKTTPELVNFMATYGRGLICTPLSATLAERFDLPFMVQKNSANHETAFTVSIDAKSASTGISALERSECIELLSKSNTQAEDFVRPGHIFPLVAKDGGVLVRTGHTEGSVDLCRLAGLPPVGVICEIINDDGTMARADDLELYAKKHQLHIVYISDIVTYRLQNEMLVKQKNSGDATLLGKRCKRIDFEDHLGRHHQAFVFGELNACAKVRFHKSLSDVALLSHDEHYNTLWKSVELMQECGGVIVFIETTQITHEQAKEYGVGAQILKLLGINKIELISGSSHNDFVALGGFGLEIVEQKEL